MDRLDGLETYLIFFNAMPDGAVPMAVRPLKTS